MCELTDDLGLSPEFLMDEDIARDESDYDCLHGSPKCGGPLRETPWGWEGGCPGCRRCDPVDHECKPYGFGFERFEDPALTEANRAINNRQDAVCGAYSLHWHGKGGCWKMFRPERDRLWEALTTQNRKLTVASDRKWFVICDRAETHGEAVRLYREWAEQTVTKMSAK